MLCSPDYLILEIGAEIATVPNGGQSAQGAGPGLPYLK
jgi:hypothetical protein